MAFSCLALAPLNGFAILGYEGALVMEIYWLRFMVMLKITNGANVVTAASMMTVREIRPLYWPHKTYSMMQTRKISNTDTIIP